MTNSTHVRAAGALALGDGDLVDREEVVGGGVGVVDDGGLVAADRAAGCAVLDVHARDEHAVEGAVARLEGRALGAGQLAEGVVERVKGQVRVEPRERVAQPLLQHDGAVAGALLAGRTGRDVGAVRGLPAEGAEPLKRGLLDVGLGEGGHVAPTPASGVHPWGPGWNRRTPALYRSRDRSLARRSAGRLPSCRRGRCNRGSSGTSATKVSSSLLQ